MIDRHVVKSIDEIDASMFSGDAFVNPEARKELREKMARWERELKNFDETFPNGSLPDES